MLCAQSLACAHSTVVGAVACGAHHTQCSGVLRVRVVHWGDVHGASVQYMLVWQCKLFG